MLAYKIAQTYKRSYVRQVKAVLGIKGKADIAAYPVFYSIVQKHYANDTTSLDRLLTIPLFSADISWNEWRRYASAKNRHLMDTALERFKEWTTSSLSLVTDWKERGLVVVLADADDEEDHGGVRASCDISPGTTNVAVDLQSQGFLISAEQNCALETPSQIRISNDSYLSITNNHHWFSHIKHLPSPLCNMKISKSGQLVPTRFIRAGEAITFDHGMPHWVYEITGIALDQWLDDTLEAQRSRLNLFERMHKTVHNCTHLLDLRIDRIEPDAVRSMRLESMLVSIEEYLDDGNNNELLD